MRWRCCRICPDARRLRVLDVGSGRRRAGDSARDRATATGSVVLVDSNHKKSAFLQQAAIELGLANVDVVTARVEDYAPAAPFDVVISRAFADLATFAAARRAPPRAGGTSVRDERRVSRTTKSRDLPPQYRVVARRHRSRCPVSTRSGTSSCIERAGAAKEGA